MHEAIPPLTTRPYNMQLNQALGNFPFLNLNEIVMSFKSTFLRFARQTARNSLLPTIHLHVLPRQILMFLVDRDINGQSVSLKRVAVFTGLRSDRSKQNKHSDACLLWQQAAVTAFGLGHWLKQQKHSRSADAKWKCRVVTQPVADSVVDIRNDNSPSGLRLTHNVILLFMPRYVV